MANEFGKGWRLHAKTGANAFTACGGETGLTWGRQSQEEDISDKDSGTYGATNYGQQRINLRLQGNLKLPDVGFAALEAASKASPPQIEVKIMKGAVVKFHGLVAVGNLSAEFPRQGPATYSVDLANAAAPIVDNLTAADA